MAGIYIHIPFCKTICHYCDFYKIANLSKISEFIKALLKEIVQKKDFLKESIQSIYFGGGTPSVLSAEMIKILIDELKKFYDLSDNCEITFEINPDDVTFQYLYDLNNLSVNRLSIGIQSFNNELLKFLNRRHTNEQAFNAVLLGRKAGFSNMSVDLIYGINGQDEQDLSNDLAEVLKLDINHLSAYHLTIEEKTLFGKLFRQGKIREIDESIGLKHFNILTDFAKKYGFEHYEISNFAKNKSYSQHNMSYWFDIPYLGFGPSAHSYVGGKRFFNVANLADYINSIHNNKTYYNFEILRREDLVNEFIMLRLRTKWGFIWEDLEERLTKTEKRKMWEKLSFFVDKGNLNFIEGRFLLNSDSYLISDYIIRELFI